MRLVFIEGDIFPIGTLVDGLGEVVVATQRLRVDWPQGIHADEMVNQYNVAVRCLVWVILLRTLAERTRTARLLSPRVLDTVSRQFTENIHSPAAIVSHLPVSQAFRRSLPVYTAGGDAKVQRVIK